MSNAPDDPVAAVTAGRQLCCHLLDPLVETFGPIVVRSAYRSATVNGFGNRQKLNCASNAANAGAHIWDTRDARDSAGASASIMIPWFSEQVAQGRPWQDLAWWMHDHLPYSSICFFMPRATFNIGWKELPEKEISAYQNGHRKLLKRGAEPSEPLADRKARYADFPPFRAIAYPQSAAWSG